MHIFTRCCSAAAWHLHAGTPPCYGSKGILRISYIDPCSGNSQRYIHSPECILWNKRHPAPDPWTRMLVDSSTDSRKTSDLQGMSSLNFLILLNVNHASNGHKLSVLFNVEYGDRKSSYSKSVSCTYGINLSDATRPQRRPVSMLPWYMLWCSGKPLLRHQPGSFHLGSRNQACTIEHTIEDRPKVMQFNRTKFCSAIRQSCYLIDCFLEGVALKWQTTT